MQLNLPHKPKKENGWVHTLALPRGSWLRWKAKSISINAAPHIAVNERPSSFRPTFAGTKGGRVAKLRSLCHKTELLKSTRFTFVFVCVAFARLKETESTAKVCMPRQQRTTRNGSRRTRKRRRGICETFCRWRGSTLHGPHTHTHNKGVATHTHVWEGSEKLKGTGRIKC